MYSPTELGTINVTEWNNMLAVIDCGTTALPSTKAPLPAGAAADPVGDENIGIPTPPTSDVVT